MPGAMKDAKVLEWNPNVLESQLNNLKLNQFEEGTLFLWDPRFLLIRKY